MVELDREAGTSKVIGLYRKLSTALDVVNVVAETDADADRADLVSIATRIRELSAELEQMLDDESEGGGDGIANAGRIRTVERDISVLVAKVQSFGRQRTMVKDGGWSY